MKSIVCITPVKHLDGVYEAINKYGKVYYLPEIDKNGLSKFLSESDAEFIFANPNKQPFILDAEVLENSNIKVINTCSTGTNHIDKAYCNDNGIAVWSLKKDFELINQLPSTAELAFGLMCCLLRKIQPAFEDVKSGNWNYEAFMGRQLNGLTIGIIGYGRLGKFMESYCKAFGMNILLYDPPKGFTDLNGLLAASDVISLHVHVEDDTRNFVNNEFLKKMKSGSYLINTSRGELVDEEAIIASLIQGHLGGYGTDVIRDEFSCERKSNLVMFAVQDPRVVITPHVGGMTWEGQTTAYRWAIKKFA